MGNVGNCNVNSVAHTLYAETCPVPTPENDTINFFLAGPENTPLRGLRKVSDLPQKGLPLRSVPRSKAKGFAF